MEIEAVARQGSGSIHVTGIVEEEEIGNGGNHTMRRKSTAYASAENVTTCLKLLGYLDNRTDLHINFPGGAPVDGPSAGISMAVAAVSALQGLPVDGATAMTGEISVQGFVRPVGGVAEKILAAKRAGLHRVLIPRENYLERFDHMDMEVIPVDTLRQALDMALMAAEIREESQDAPVPAQTALVAASTKNALGAK